MFSFGVVVHELFTGVIPNRSMRQIVKGELPSLPSQVEKDYPTIWKLFKEATTIEPKKRPSSRKLLELINK